MSHRDVIIALDFKSGADALAFLDKFTEESPL